MFHLISWIVPTEDQAELEAESRALEPVMGLSGQGASLEHWAVILYSLVDILNSPVIMTTARTEGTPEVAESLNQVSII